MAQTIKPATPEQTTLAESRTPHHPLSSLRREIDRLFDEVLGGNFAFPWRSAFYSDSAWLAWHNGLSAAMDIVEDDDKYEIAAELPGIDGKDIDGSLVIKGEKEEQKEERESNRHLSERRFGSFRRSFCLPEGVDARRIDAAFKNGVLRVTLPKTAVAKTEQTITVKAI